MVTDGGNLAHGWSISAQPARIAGVLGKRVRSEGMGVRHPDHNLPGLIHNPARWIQYITGRSDDQGNLAQDLLPLQLWQHKLGGVEEPDCQGAARCRGKATALGGRGALMIVNALSSSDVNDVRSDLNRKGGRPSL
jgi:hypothetical protein